MYVQKGGGWENITPPWKYLERVQWFWKCSIFDRQLHDVLKSHINGTDKNESKTLQKAPYICLISWNELWNIYVLFYILYAINKKALLLLLIGFSCFYLFCKCKLYCNTTCTVYIFTLSARVYTPTYWSGWK